MASPSSLAFSSKLTFTYFDLSVVLLAVIANVLMLVAIIRSDLRLSGYRRFLISLTAADLYMCFVNLLTLLYQMLTSSANNNDGANPANNNNNNNQSLVASIQIAHPAIVTCGANVLRTLKLAGFFNNLLNLCGMSIDNFIGVMHPMRYHYLMSKGAARLAVIAIWIFSFLLAFLDVPINIAVYHFTSSDVDSATRSAEMFPQDQAGQFSSQTFNEFSSSLMAAFFRNGSTANILDDNVSSREINLQNSSSVMIGAAYSGRANSNSSSSGSGSVKNARESLSRMLSLLHDQDEREQREQNACMFYGAGKMWMELAVVALTAVCFAFLIVCYGFVFKKVSNRLDMTGNRNRKLIVTTIIFLGAFAVCWLPFMINELTMLIIFQRSEQTTSKSAPLPSESSMAPEYNADFKHRFYKFFMVSKIFSSLLMVYPLVDPIIYAARIPTVQKSLLHIISTILPCFPCIAAYEKKLHSTRPSLLTVLALTNSTARASSAGAGLMAAAAANNNNNNKNAKNADATLPRRRTHGSISCDMLLPPTSKAAGNKKRTSSAAITNKQTNQDQNNNNNGSSNGTSSSSPMLLPFLMSSPSIPE